MRECRNCGSDVSIRYVKLFAPEGFDNPSVCPHCPDKLRDGATVRDARSSRSA